MGPCCLLGGSLPSPRRGGEVCRRNPHNGGEVLALSSSAPSEMPAACGANTNHRQRRLKCKESSGAGERRVFPCASEPMRTKHQRADSHGQREVQEQATGLSLVQPVPRVLRAAPHLSFLGGKDQVCPAGFGWAWRHFPPECVSHPSPRCGRALPTRTHLEPSRGLLRSWPGSSPRGAGAQGGLARPRGGAWHGTDSRRVRQRSASPQGLEQERSGRGWGEPKPRGLWSQAEGPRMQSAPPPLPPADLPAHIPSVSCVCRDLLLPRSCQHPAEALVSLPSSLRSAPRPAPPSSRTCPPVSGSRA